MTDPLVRNLKIKTGVVKRLTKEKISYEKEVEYHEARLQKFKDEGKDEYEIKKQNEVLEETLKMVPECQRRLAKGCEDLQTFLDAEEGLKEHEEYETAKKVLEEGKREL